jgi:hypothetical protein
VWRNGTHEGEINTHSRDDEGFELSWGGSSPFFGVILKKHHGI